MATEEEEEVVILQTSDDELSEEITDLKLEGEHSDPIDEELSKPEYQDEAIEEEKLRNRKKLIIIISIVFLVIIIAILAILIIVKLNKKPIEPQDTTQIIEKIQKREKTSKFTPSKIDKMIQQANILYEKGNKLEALDIYKNIAAYNEAISQYNIGVAQMKEGNFKDALVAFKNAILNKEKRAVSAINGAICALRLNDEKLFNYYLDLAYTYLPEENNSPLYSYYVGLINYYKENYYEALLAFSHPSTKHYLSRQEYLASKISTFLDRSYDALNFLQKQKNMFDDFALGLLYARIGDFTLAEKTLNKSIKNFENVDRASLALVLVDLKLGKFKNAADILKTQYDKNQTFAKNTYPIKTILNRSLFNVNLAQEEYKKNIFFTKKNQYALLFYFAPYKVFNAKQTIGMIRKGGLNVFIDEIDSGLNYLQTSSTISKINESMSEAIKKALTHHYLQANKQLKELVKSYSKHSILQYNLALTYAQLGNYTLAYKHFTASYRLDSKNYMAGIFAMMSGEIIGQKTDKLLEEVKRDIDQDKSLDNVNFFITLTHLIENNQLSMNRWLEIDKSDVPLHLVFDIITSYLVQNNKIYLEKIYKLKNLLPKDIMANILYFNAKYENSDIKEYAKQIQMEFNNNTLDISSFYYGSSLIKEQYVKLLQISGLVHVKRDKLKKRLETEIEDVVGITQALAYLSLYTNDFEESYVLYNLLIDEHNQQDTNTIFYGAIASIGANHVENAIALLELSKLIDSNNFESRYGLGLLYQEIKNLEGASIQYDQIGNSGFKSKYFDFEIID